MWTVASAQSTSSPFIQIFFVSRICGSSLRSCAGPGIVPVRLAQLGRAGVREPQEVERRDTGHVALGAGSDPDAVVDQKLSGHQHQRRAAVADEDEGLDDLRTRSSDGPGRGAGGRRSLRELLDARVDAGPLNYLCDPRHGLRPALHGGNVARRNRTAALAVQTPGDDTVERETIVNENERRALNEALFRDVNERIAE